MPAYLHAELLITDPVLYRRYGEEVAPLVSAHGGRYLVRGGAVQVKEGDAPVRWKVVVEFPDMAAAQAFYDAPAYAPLIAMRQRCSQGTLVLVEGG